MPAVAKLLWRKCTAGGRVLRTVQTDKAKAFMVYRGDSTNIPVVRPLHLNQALRTPHSLSGKVRSGSGAAAEKSGCKACAHTICRTSLTAAAIERASAIAGLAASGASMLAAPPQRVSAPCSSPSDRWPESADTEIPTASSVLTITDLPGRANTLASAASCVRLLFSPRSPISLHTTTHSTHTSLRLPTTSQHHEQYTSIHARSSLPRTVHRTASQTFLAHMDISRH
ncbi:hypothetical protein Q7P37_006491 [Cladosporium fusiforme]